MRPRLRRGVLGLTAAAVLVAAVVGGARLRQVVAPVSSPWSTDLHATATGVYYDQGGTDQTVIEVELSAAETPRRITAVTLSGTGWPAGRSLTAPVPGQVERRPGSPERELFRLVVPLGCLSLEERGSAVLGLTVTVERSSGATATSSTFVQDWEQVAPWCPAPELEAVRGAPATGHDLLTDPGHPQQATVRVSGLPRGRLRLGMPVDASFTAEFVTTPPGDGTATVRLRPNECAAGYPSVPLGLTLALTDATGTTRHHYVRVGPQLARWYLAVHTGPC